MRRSAGIADRIEAPWGARTPYGAGEEWPARRDMQLSVELEEEQTGSDLEPLNNRLAQQNPNLKIAVPILPAQGLADTTVLPPLTDQLDEELRARRNKVRYMTYPDVEHVGIVGAADRATRRFFKARLK